MNIYTIIGLVWIFLLWCGIGFMYFLSKADNNYSISKEYLIVFLSGPAVWLYIFLYAIDLTISWATFKINKAILNFRIKRAKNRLKEALSTGATIQLLAEIRYTIGDLRSKRYKLDDDNKRDKNGRS